MDVGKGECIKSYAILDSVQVGDRVSLYWCGPHHVIRDRGDRNNCTIANVRSAIKVEFPIKDEIPIESVWSVPHRAIRELRSRMRS